MTSSTSTNYIHPTTTNTETPKPVFTELSNISTQPKEIKMTLPEISTPVKIFVGGIIFAFSLVTVVYIGAQVGEMHQERRHAEEIHKLYVDDKKSEIETNKELRKLQIEATKNEVRKKKGERVSMAG